MPTVDTKESEDASHYLSHLMRLFFPGGEGVTLKLKKKFFGHSLLPFFGGVTLNKAFFFGGGHTENFAFFVLAA